MKVIFKYPRKLNVLGESGKKEGKLFVADKLPQSVPDALKDDWFFKALMKAGDISVVPDEVANSKSEKPPEKEKAAPSQSQKKG
jgi:hypothetical protein